MRVLNAGCSVMCLGARNRIRLSGTLYQFDIISAAFPEIAEILEARAPIQFRASRGGSGKKTGALTVRNDAEPAPSWLELN